MNASERNQLRMWRALVARPELSHFQRAEVAGLLGIAERLEAACADLADDLRDQIALNVLLGRELRDAGVTARGERVHLDLLPDRPEPAA